MSPALGYLDDHPSAIASQTSPHHWDMALMMAGVPTLPIPSRWLSPDLRPTALDQDGIGACVAFAATTIRDAQDFTDWGKHLYATGSNGTTKSGAFLAYDWLKHGHGTFPGDGIPDVEGSYPEAAWKLARAEGIPDATDKPHRITAYYAHAFESDADLAFLQGVLLAWGPVNVASPWPANWMAAPSGANHLMPSPVGRAGGHSYTIVGWETYGGVMYLTCMNSWGFWGSAQGLFRFPADWLYQLPLGPQVIWKTVDEKDGLAMPLTLTDKVSRILDTHVGAPLLSTANPATVLTTVKSGELGIASAAALTSGTTAYYAVIVSVGGVIQLAALKQSDATNVRPTGGDPAALAAAEAKGAKAVKDAAIAEAIFHGG